MKRRAGIGAVLVLVLLAGCFGGPGSNGSPTATSPDPSPTPTAFGATAPGVPGGTLQNVTALLEAHNSTLHEAGFVLDVTAGNQTFRYTVASEGPIRSIEATDGSVSVWTNGTASVTRRSTEDGVVYQRPGGELAPDRMTRLTRLQALVTSASYARTGTNQCGDATCIELRADSAIAGQYANFTADLRVDTDGVIRSLEVEYVRSDDEDASPSTFQYEVVQIGGVSAGQPDWVAEGLAELES